MTLTPDVMRKRLQKALDLAGGIYSVEDVAEEVRAGRMQSWYTESSLVLTQILPYPQKKVLHVMAVVGDMNEAMSMQPRVEAFGREHGCSLMTTAGRRGWTRILPGYGWTVADTVVYERPIGDVDDG